MYKNLIQDTFCSNALCFQFLDITAKDIISLFSENPRNWAHIKQGSKK